MRPNLAQLEEFRRELDRIDSQIGSLLVERVGVVRKVFEWKRRWGLPLHDAEREAAILQRMSESAPDGIRPDSVVQIFRVILDETRKSAES